MSRRARSARAVSPDITSVWTTTKRASKTKKVANDVGELHVGSESVKMEDDCEEDMKIECAIHEERAGVNNSEVTKKKRGRPKKNVVTAKNISRSRSPDINPSSSPVLENHSNIDECVEKLSLQDEESKGDNACGDISPDIMHNYSSDDGCANEDYVFRKEDKGLDAESYVSPVISESEPQMDPPDTVAETTVLNGTTEEPLVVTGECEHPAIIDEPGLNQKLFSSQPPSVTPDSSSGQVFCEIKSESVEIMEKSVEDKGCVDSVNNTQSSETFLADSIFGRKYDPGVIPGLDFTGSEENHTKEADQLCYGSIMAKKIFENDVHASKPEEKKEVIKSEDYDVHERDDDTDQKIRRSSRIKSLEGCRSRRREVVFSNRDTSSRSQSVADDDDSSSLHSFEMRLLSPSRDSSSSRASSPCEDKESLLEVRTRFNSDAGSKPVRVKSRWRASTDVDGTNDASNMFRNSESKTGVPEAVESKPVVIPPSLQRNLVRKPGHILYDSIDEELTEKLKKFEGVDESLFFTERKVSKESKYMVCDCYLSKEDISRGEIGCNEDCLNRLLMIECGSRCPTGDRCTNKRFQRKEYCKLEVFKTEKKGHGLRTLTPLPAGGFVIEYVGEVLNPRGFTLRTKEYAKEKQEHFYFMALTSDSIIDATLKGNCSRFINHSCDPNCETQKWTVNGELRIGFFAQRDLQAGEEITFDYQFQRYGKKAQRCFCMTEKCRGWIGGDEEEEEDEDEDGENREPDIDDMDLNEVAGRKMKSKVPRRRKKRIASTVNDFGDRFKEELLSLEKTGLKNKNHTLTLCRLMVRAEDWEARNRILSIIINGDQPCRRLFLDYRGLRLLHGWMSTLPVPREGSSLAHELYHLKLLEALRALPIPNKTCLKDSELFSLVQKWSELKSSRESSTSARTQSEGETGVQTSAVSNSMLSDDSIVQRNEALSTGDATTEIVPENRRSFEIPWKFVEESKEMFSIWSNLKEEFRIPKKERVEQMKEHEREADKSDSVQNAQEKEKSGSNDRDRSSIKARKLERRFNLVDFINSVKKEGNLSYSKFKSMSKEEKRIMFAKHVARIEQERTQRKTTEDLIALHTERCRRLNLDEISTPMVDPSGTYYLDPNLIQWKTIDPEDTTLPAGVLTLMQFALCPEMVPVAEQPQEVSFPPWPEVFPPPPPFPPANLPSGWAMNFDDEGRIYFYHARTRIVQWELPKHDSPEFCDQSSSSESSEEEVEVNGDTLEAADEEAPRDMERMSKAEERRERRRSSGLVQERIISPRSEDDKPVLSQKMIRARKLELMQERMHEIFYDEDDDGDIAPDEAIVETHKHSKKSGSPSRKKRKTHSSSEFNVDVENHMEKEADVDAAADGDNGPISPNETEPMVQQSVPDEVNHHVRVRSRDRKKSHKKSRSGSSKSVDRPVEAGGSKRSKEKSVEDAFRGEIAGLIVQYLNPYRKEGRIKTTEDFKHLARKLTHMVTTKEIKHCKTSKTGTNNLEVNDSVKHKAKEFVRKYMGRYADREYVRSPQHARPDES